MLSWFRETVFCEFKLDGVCVFRPDLGTDSGGIRALIPE